MKFGGEAITSSVSHEKWKYHLPENHDFLEAARFYHLNLADLLSNRCSFLFQGSLLVSVLFQAIIDLFAVVFLIFLNNYDMFSLASLVTIKQSLPPSLDKNTIAISFAIEQSKLIISCCFCRALWAKLP